MKLIAVMEDMVADGKIDDARPDDACPDGNIVSEYTKFGPIMIYPAPYLRMLVNVLHGENKARSPTYCGISVDKVIRTTRSD